MERETKDICDGYGFRFLEDVETPAAGLMAIGKESRHDNSYFWDNRSRGPAFLFQYTLSGSGVLETEEGVFKAEAGDGFFLQFPGNERYYFDETQSKEPWEFFYILINGACVLPYYRYFVRRFGKITPLPQCHPAVQKLFDLHAMARGGRIRSAFAASREAFGFLCLLCGGVEEADRAYSPLVESAVSYMEHHFGEELALSALSERLGVSQSHLSREFLRETGEQPIRFLTKLRLEKAIELLNTTDMNLQEISGACGFAESNYFSKVFRKYMKASPGKFRKHVQREGYVNVQI